MKYLAKYAEPEAGIASLLASERGERWDEAVVLPACEPALVGI